MGEWGTSEEAARDPLHRYLEKELLEELVRRIDVWLAERRGWPGVDPRPGGGEAAPEVVSAIEAKHRYLARLEVMEWRRREV